MSNRKRTAHIFVAGISLFLAVILMADVRAAALSNVTRTVISINSPPVAQNIEVTTYRGVTVSSNFCCVDPEGDLVTYVLTASPAKGTVEITGDTFTYTPDDGEKGKDSFSYAAVDCHGNMSNKAKVTVRIKKQTASVTYADLVGNPVGYAAAVLAEKGVFIGKQIGGKYFFDPEAEVTRGEFIAMCMEVSDTELLDGIVRTGFSDDADIPLWAKQYVATALMADAISGYTDDEGRIVFSSDRTVTHAEAGVMLNNILGISDVSIKDSELGSCPVWASQAAMNLLSCDIPVAESGYYSSPMTRGDAAVMLSGAMEVLEAR